MAVEPEKEERGRQTEADSSLPPYLAEFLGQ